MKQTNSTIQTIATKLFHHGSQVQRIKLMHPNRDWTVGVMVGIGIMIMMGGWSTYVYFEQRDGVAESGALDADSIPVYRASVVDEALQVIAGREQSLADLQRNRISAPIAESPENSATSTSRMGETAVELDENLLPVTESEVTPQVESNSTELDETDPLGATTTSTEEDTDEAELLDTPDAAGLILNQ